MDDEIASEKLYNEADPVESTTSEEVKKDEKGSLLGNKPLDLGKKTTLLGKEPEKVEAPEKPFDPREWKKEYTGDSPADRMYSDSLNDPERSPYQGLNETVTSMFDAAEGTVEIKPGQREEAFSEVSSFFSNLQIPPTEAKTLFSEVISKCSSPLTDEQVRKMSVETMNDLRGTYGENTDKILGLVRLYVGENPALSQILSHSGMGSDPKIVKLLCDRVYRLNSRGKLKWNVSKRERNHSKVNA